MHYFADWRWWEWHKDKPEYLAIRAERASIENSLGIITDPSVWILHNYNNEQSRNILSDVPNGIATGQNGGHQAINIAYLAGAKRILLLGFDMQADSKGRMHWHDDHPIPTQSAIFPTMLTHLSRLAPLIKSKGVEVINCTPGGALNCFTRMSLDEALACVLPDPSTATLPA